FAKAEIRGLAHCHFSPGSLYLDVDRALEGISRHRRSVTHALGPAVRVAALSGLKLRRGWRTAVASGITNAWLAKFFAHLGHSSQIRDIWPKSASALGGTTRSHELAEPWPPHSPTAPESVRI